MVDEFIMKYSFKYNPKFNDKCLKIIEELSWHTTKLYNIVNHDILNNEFLNYYDIERIYKSNWHCEWLHSHNRQWCFKLIDQNWKSFFAGLSDWKSHPNKYCGMPKSPKFKNQNTKNEVIFTKAAIRIQNSQLKLSLSKNMKSKFRVKSLNFNLNSKIKSLINFENVNQIRISWNRILKEWSLIIIYEKDEYYAPDSFNNVMSIDLGLNNLATCVFKNHNTSIIINGRPLKSINSYYNYKISKLQSIRMKQLGNPKLYSDTKQILSLRKKRHNKIQDYLHKASSKIVKLALKSKSRVILIGDLNDIKRGLKGKHIKSFVQIPFKRLVNMIQYKSRIHGIDVKVVNESYTSGVSALDLEPDSKPYYNKSRRIARGLFKSNNGIMINADVNGALNIMKKAFTSISRLVLSARSKGYVNNPLKLTC